jgi:hypothetical protein
MCAKPLSCAALLVAVLAAPVFGATLVVDAGAPPGGDGTREAPFSDFDAALGAARSIRAASDETIVIQATGRFVITHELLCNVPRLKIFGKLRLRHDERGRPTGAEPGTETTIAASGDLVNVDRALLAITASEVEIAGLVFDGGDPAIANVAVDCCDEAQFHWQTGAFVQGASRFVVRGCSFQGVAVPIFTRLSGGRVEGSLFAGGALAGCVLDGGTAAQPAAIDVERCTMEGCGEGAVVISGEVGAGLASPPGVAPVADESFGDETRLDVTIANSGLAGGSHGLRIFPRTHWSTLPPGDTRDFDAAARVVALVHGNTFTNNGFYAVTADFPLRRTLSASSAGAQTWCRTPAAPVTVEATFFENTYAGNGFFFGPDYPNPGFFGFELLYKHLGFFLVNAESFHMGATMQITDLDGEFVDAGGALHADIDNPACDPDSQCISAPPCDAGGGPCSGTSTPIDGTHPALGNVLRFNGGPNRITAPCPSSGG